MEFSYEDITIGVLDIEFNYVNIELACDGDNQVIRVGMYDDTKR